MVDEPEHEEQPSPGVEVVQNFSNEVRAGIVTATELAVKRVAFGYLITGLVAAVVGGCVSWLMLSYFQSKESGIQFRVQYGDTVAACSRGADLADGAPVVVCYPVLR